MARYDSASYDTLGAHVRNVTFGVDLENAADAAGLINHNASIEMSANGRLIPQAIRIVGSGPQRLHSDGTLTHHYSGVSGSDAFTGAADLLKETNLRIAKYGKDGVVAFDANKLTYLIQREANPEPHMTWHDGGLKAYRRDLAAKLNEKEAPVISNAGPEISAAVKRSVTHAPRAHTDYRSGALT